MTTGLITLAFPEIEAEGEEDDEDDEEEGINFSRLPAAHTVVLFDSQLERDALAEEEEEGVGLPLSVLDPLSLPGTPADGSSYSSTNSGHVLLSQNCSHREDRSSACLDSSPAP